MQDATRLPATEIAGPTRQGSRLSRTVLCLLLLGCSGNNAWQAPTVVLDTAGGPTTLLSPAPAMPGGAVGPPPGLEGTAPSSPVQPVSRDGSYVGTAVPLDTGGGLCIATHQVSGFHVQGNSVRFGGFRGTIDANNGLQMVSRRDWIVGQFDGDTFRGQMDVTGRLDTPGCTFMMTLQRAGT
jgi:hypothetical protein